jgi:hypothetical protein
MLKPGKKLGAFKSKVDKFKNSTLNNLLLIDGVDDINVIYTNDINTKILPSSENVANLIFTNQNRDVSGIISQSTEVYVFASMIGPRQSLVLKNSSVCCGNYFAKHKKNERGNLKGRVKDRLNHSKIVAIKYDGSYYTIISSANLSMDTSNEYYLIFKGVEVYDFIKKTFEDV